MIDRAFDALAFLIAFIRARWGYRFRDRVALLAYQERRIGRLLTGAATRAAFYRARRGTPFHELPVVSKADMLRSFARFNTHGIELEEAQGVAFAAEVARDFEPTLPGGITVGSSSGTSGRPSVFLVSRRERAVWAGTILGKMLEASLLRRALNPFARPVRIALFLRANSNLYTTVRGSRIRFAFFDLVAPLDTHAERLSEYSPDILVGPASVLGHLAGMQQAGSVKVGPLQVISVAETLEADDAQAVSAAWRIEPQQIYQCTEGFLGCSCTHGSVHLNEEFVHFETTPLGANRLSACVTDFSRKTQLFVRFQMDDVLRADPEPCPCGRVTLRLASIEGRQDDVLWLPSADGGDLRPVFPDQVRRAIMLAVPSCEDYRLRQHGLSIEIALPDAPAADWADASARIRAQLAELCKSQGIREPKLTRAGWPVAARTDKRRRIVCVSRPEPWRGAA